MPRPTSASSGATALARMADLPPPAFPLPALPVAVYRLAFTAQSAIRLPAYAGSAWRGVFGRALKRLVCVTRAAACPPCLLYRSCIYPYLFETPPDPAVGKLRKYNAAPHPFVLRPGTGGAHQPGAQVNVGLVLFGHGNRQLPYILHSFAQAGQRGVGQGDGRLELQQVWQQTPTSDWHVIYAVGGALEPLPSAVPVLPPCPRRVQIALDTPLRINQAEKLLTPATFQFGALFSNLLRRISLLTTFHTDTPLDTDFAALSRSGWRVETEATRLRWHEWVRYSSRQDALVQMGGLLGDIELVGAGLEPFWPYLWLGQWTHAGKATSMGLGQYRLMLD